MLETPKGLKTSNAFEGRIKLYICILVKFLNILQWTISRKPNQYIMHYIYKYSPVSFLRNVGKKSTDTYKRLESSETIRETLFL